MHGSHAWRREDDQYILDYFGKLTYSEMGRRLGDGMSRHHIRGRHLRLQEWLAQWKRKNPHLSDRKALLQFLQELHERPTLPTTPEPRRTTGGTTVERTQTQDHLSYVAKSTEIKSVEDLIRYAKIDITKWKCVRQVVNKWEVGAVIEKRIVTQPLFQVKAWFEPIGEQESPAAIRRALIDEIKRHAPTFPRLKFHPHVSLSTETNAAELFIPDPHHGKLCWAPETGNNWDSSISERTYSLAIDSLMARTHGLNIDLILLPIGNDFFHTDTPQNTTTAGTPQDVDGRWQKTFRRMRKMLVTKVEQLRTIAPVKLIIVPGNHDETKMYYLGDALECWFHNCSNVEVDNLPKLRKYQAYGISLIGYAHGDKEKMVNYPMLMAHEAKQLFAQTKYYEWHLGHLHKREERKRVIADQVNTDTIDGVVLRRTPSLGGTDAWHYGKGYVHSPRQADLFLWGRETGPVGYHTYHYWGEVEKVPA